MASKKIGSASVYFENPPKLLSSGTVVGDIEGAGPLGKHFDIVLEDDTLGEASYEKAECMMFERAARIAAQKINVDPANLDFMLGGDLLNQISVSDYAARQLGMPFIGLYGACSTFSESLLVGSMLVDGGFGRIVGCTVSSHFSTAERQFRMPLEYGNQTPPTAQRTVTGAGSIMLGENSIIADENIANGVFNNLHITGGTIGKVIDLGINDPNNMGAAMAPAAADTLNTYFLDTGKSVKDFDLIITGDLGSFGSEMFADLCRDKGIKLVDKHFDCGLTIFGPEHETDCGGSGCGCSATVLSSYLLKRMAAGDFSKAFFMATGALMNPMMNLQGETIPCIAHGITIERWAK